MSATTHDHAHGHEDHKPAFLVRWLCSTNHKDIGTLYLSFAMIGGLIGGILSEIMRAQLNFPGDTIVTSGQEWNTIVTSHGLLMIFFLLFNHFHASPSRAVVFGMCAGSFMNPIGFIALAMKPTLRQQPNSPFGAIMATSFTLTTIGYAGAAWSVGLAALRAL